MLSQKYFYEQLQNIFPDGQNPTFLLAVSGGVDSMVLLELFSNLKSQISNLKFMVAHINYKLRGEDSDLDQELVEKFCEKQDVKLHIYQVSERDQKPEGSIQLWARELRYRFFREIQEKENLEILVTAHHLNDQLETFLINLSRGSGIAGLSGIPANDNKILRPLLKFSKSDIYQFAKEREIPFREDVSNQKNDYLRNKIRNKIIPELIGINVHFLENFQKSLSILGQGKEFINVQIQPILEGLTIKKEQGFCILDKNKLSQETDFVKFEILKKFGFDNEMENGKIFIAETGKKFYSKEWQLLIDREQLVFSNWHLVAVNQSLEEIELEIIDNNIYIENQTLLANNQKLKATKEWQINSEKISFPLKLRHPKSDDVFCPSGMKGKKKVSKFLKDEKIPLSERKKIWLLCDSEEQVLAVLPLRQDERFLAKKADEGALKIIFKS